MMDWSSAEGGGGGGGGGGVVGELDWGWRGGGEWEIGVPNQ
jgi:hypothetical protein